MIRLRTLLLAGILPLIFAVGPVDARGLEYKVDPVHSSVTFKVKNKGISYVFGRFNKISGIFKANKLRNPSTIKIDAEVVTKSIDTGNNKRNNIIKGKQYLDSKKNSTISFKTKSATDIDEDNKFELTGTLNFFGTDKVIKVQCELVGMVKIDALTRRAGILATFTIKRSEFGMDYNLEEIDDEVTITVSLEGELKINPAG